MRQKEKSQLPNYWKTFHTSGQYQLCTHSALSPLPGEHSGQAPFYRHAHANSTTIKFGSYQLHIYIPGARAAMWIKCLAEGQKYQTIMGIEPRLSGRESGIHTNIQHRLCTYVCLKSWIFDCRYTVKPRPEAHMDMILFEVCLKSIDLIPQQQIHLQWHYLYYRWCHCTIWSCGNKVDILQKHFKKDHVHMRLWTRFYGIRTVCTFLRDCPYTFDLSNQLTAEKKRKTLGDQYPHNVTLLHYSGFEWKVEL